MSLTASMLDKRTGLSETIEDQLNAHLSDGTTWNMASRFRRKVERSSGQKVDRDAIMGSPIRYCRVSFIGTADETEPLDMNVAGGVAQATHTFVVLIWMEYIDADTYEDSTQALWDLVVAGRAPAVTGILPLLRDAGGIDLGEHVAYLSAPFDVIVPDEPEYMGDEQYAHYAQFFINLK